MTRFTDDLFRTLYFAEWERKDKHDSMDTFLLAAVTLLGGIGAYYLRILPSATGWWGVALAHFFWAFVIDFGCATIFLAFSVWPRNMAYVTDPRLLFRYLEGLRAHYQVAEPDLDKQDAATDADMQKSMVDLYVDASSQNRYNNRVKSVWQGRTKSCLVIGVLIVLANALPTYYVQQLHAERTSASAKDAQ